MFRYYKYGKLLFGQATSLQVHGNNGIKRFLLDGTFKIEPTLLARI